ncbi:MAG: tRNA-specific adenosine deaminase [Candidatus Pacebacteria bacterium CG10_big_fil_rev_8_21_14_0_10_42_12]|nr:MAG: tRNA-specific adenosine deaminase [Candidatus Pacebacteria bacterium CG10_big_fil_rev_8_21_14_0_10_42_12]
MSKDQNKIDNEFMKEALLEAKKSLDAGDWAVGCVIVIDNKVVARGRNRVYSTGNKLAHAEVEAMNSIAELLASRGEDATLYVTLEPCPMCMGAILLTHFKRVVCGVDANGSGSFSIIRSGSLPTFFTKSKYQFEIDQSVMVDECSSLFLTGVEKKGKKK